jgi:hypothetical protein
MFLVNKLLQKRQQLVYVFIDTTEVWADISKYNYRHNHFFFTVYWISSYNSYMRGYSAFIWLWRLQMYTFKDNHTHAVYVFIAPAYTKGWKMYEITNFVLYLIDHVRMHSNPHHIETVWTFYQWQSLNTSTWPKCWTVNISNNWYAMKHVNIRADPQWPGRGLVVKQCLDSLMKLPCTFDDYISDTHVPGRTSSASHLSVSAVQTLHALLLSKGVIWLDFVLSDNYRGHHRVYLHHQISSCRRKASE